MTTTNQRKASMHILKTSADPLVSQGARRATEETSGSAAPTTQPGADTEVVPRARRRQFSNADKRRILDAAWKEFATRHLAENTDRARDFSAFVHAQGLSQMPYLLSTDLGTTYRVSRLPYGILIDAQGMVRAKGLAVQTCACPKEPDLPLVEAFRRAVAQEVAA